MTSHIELSPLPPPESVRPATLGRLLFRAFQGYETDTYISPQLRFLYKYNMVSSLISGSPQRDLTFHEVPETHWQQNSYADHQVTTTDQRTAYSPYLDPTIVECAPRIITVTDEHHKSMRVTQSMVVTQEVLGTMNPFWYNKSEEAVHPHPLGDLRMVNRLMQDVPQEPLGGALIQLWELGFDDTVGQRYELQANLSCLSISLYTFLRVMAASPDMINRLETQVDSR